MSGGRQQFVEHSDRSIQPHQDKSGPVGTLNGAASGANEVAGLTRLERTIQAEIVPRLMLAHRDGTASPDGSPAYAVSPPGVDEISELARLLIGHDAGLGADYIEAMRAKGLSVESIFVDLLTPTARLLGRMWMEDTCTFTHVTIGLSRLQHILNDLATEFSCEVDRRQLAGPRAAFIAVPGEQHTFGLQMVREFFRRDGWDVWAPVSDQPSGLVRLVREEWITLVGMTMSTAGLEDVASSLIERLRAASLNRQLIVVIGGYCVLEDPGVIERVGADAGPTNPQGALHLGRKHFERLNSVLRH